MSGRRVAVVAGGRTPFIKAGKSFRDLGPVKLATHAVTGLIERHGVDPAGIEAIAYARYGLVSIYAAGGMAGAFLLERNDSTPKLERVEVR